MKRFLCFLFCAFTGWTAFAEQVKQLENDTNATLFLTINRIGLDWSNTNVKNSAEYQYSSIQALKATSQNYIKGVFDSVLEYSIKKITWNTGLLLEYGQTTLKPYNAPEVINENADNILLSSDLSYSCWKLLNLKIGPTFRVAYDTEFIARDSIPKQNIIRASPGIALFDNDIIKSLYFTGVYEYDFTYEEVNNKFGLEFGGRLEYVPRKGVKLSANGYFREYLSYSAYIPYDLERDLNIALRMDTNMWGKFTMGPYVQYRLAKARGTDVYGSNFMVGISFSYIDKYKLF